MIASGGDALGAAGERSRSAPGRTLQINSGATATMDADATDLHGRTGATIENAGTFNANGDQANEQRIFNNGGTGQLFHNTGTFTQVRHRPFRSPSRSTTTAR